MNPTEIFRERIPEDQSPLRVDKVVVSLMPDVTRASVQRWIEDGRVLIDGKPCRPKDKVRPGSLVEVRPDLPPESLALPDPAVVVDVVYEDAFLLVVNKPAGLVVHPGRGHSSGTLVNGLLARPGFERAPTDPSDPMGYLRPGIVHRIDKDTSGLLVVAKEPRAREGLKKQLAEHTVERVYLALTQGCPRSQSVETLHGRHPRSRLRFTSRVASGKVARTSIVLEERLAGGRAGRVTCRLATGRTHQIRVHLSEQTSTPLLGDRLYGTEIRDASLTPIVEALGRQALHAMVLGFTHPITGEELHFEAQVPEDMTQALSRLRALG